tara:strand:- start:159 stop:407 length:249 start_codon:yes stop_codon:yes gene_type:complete
MINWIENSAYALGLASKGNPFIAVVTVFVFWIMFSAMEAGIEKLIWGERFEHWLDPVFILIFMGYAGLAVWQCAIINYNKVI